MASALLPAVQLTPQTPNIPAFYLDHYRRKFAARVAAGEARPLVIPYSLAGPLILPVLYLAIPHTKRPWLYRARFVVAAAMLALNAWTAATTSSTNMAVAYGVGLMAVFGSFWGLAVVVFMRVQFESARVEMRPRKMKKNDVGEAGPDEQAGGGGGGGFVYAVIDGQPVPDESVAATIGEYEYYWQTYPETGSFLQRLDWVWDLYTSFRGTGWTHAIPSIPSPTRPKDPHSSPPPAVDLSSIPLATRTGYHRSQTRASFHRNRLLHMLWSYLILDLWTITARHDPYFIPGPVPNTPLPPLPPLLASLPPPLLSVLRTALGSLGILAALGLYMNLYQLLAFSLLRGSSNSPRGQLWQYPSIFGSFPRTVLTRGLAGLWGGWWHQTFRLGFTAPTVFAVRRGWLDARPRAASTRLLALFVAFLLSGALHAAGGYTAIPHTTRARGPLAFFVGSFAGVVAQTAACALCRPWIERVPRPWRGVGNALFVALWMHATMGAVVEDMSRAGLWLYEPVPVSVVRLVGVGGMQGEGWWRWDRQFLPRWYSGRHWWESGIRL
ncbi:membrane bound O-acyl transferase family-domain-containing protein [Podospora appendiculata]|uniref:Membrane bound O-acyl transferase family-domain-containing protein n=1 Tax=Podospora appendiculata TaxID=314037 RepID=A0AAE0XKA2_9PEZI|nr:membrane bound O-acyl transferase family-domain-containing protein [Podospora appendiculata]